MKEDLEDYQYSDHRDIHFVYDEEPGPQASAQPQEDGNSQGQKSWRRVMALAAAVLLVLLVCVMVWGIWGKKAVNPEETSVKAGETSAEEISTDETRTADTDWTEQLKAYMAELYRDTDIQYVTESGSYMPWQCLLLELDGEDAYPEGVALRWKEEEQHYSLFTYSYSESGQGESRVAAREYALKAAQAQQGQIDAITVNHCQTDSCVDLLLSRHTDDGKNSSIFMRCFKGDWICLGTAEVVYCLRGPYTFFGTAAYTYWTVKDSSLQSDSQISYNQTYWTLQDAPEWYLRRPVAAYAQTDMGMDDTQVILLQGKSLRLTGVLMWNDAAYFKVETDTKEAGYILLDHPEKGTSCQVQLQSLPFEEVFSTEPVDEDSVSADAYTPFLQKLDRAMMKTVLPGEEYSAWVDFNGDGIYEKLYAKATKAVHEEGSVKLMVRILIDDHLLADTVYAGEQLQLFVLDINPADQWLEIGYGDGPECSWAEIYRYDGTNIRSLGLSSCYSFDISHILNIEELLNDEEEKTESVTVRGDWSGHAYEYEIGLQPETGMFFKQPVTVCKLENPVSCTVWESAVLYDVMDGEALTIVRAGEKLSLVSIYADFREDADGKYYGCFQLENGEYGYSEAVDDDRFLINIFDLTELFGPMAG